MVVKNNLDEAAYPGNLGFAELYRFHQKATPQQKQELSAALERGDIEKFFKLIHEVTGVKLYR